MVSTARHSDSVRPWTRPWASSRCLTSMMRAIFSARSMWRPNQYRLSAVRLSIPGLFLDDPGVFGAAALRRIDHQGTSGQRHAGQAARHDRHSILAGQHEGPEIDVARRHALFDEGRAG